MAELFKQQEFDLKLALECAQAFAITSSLGCAVSNSEGELFESIGYSCNDCRICALAGIEHDTCIQAHIQGMTEAERFGGKYIYFCPMGLTCFVSPIVGNEKTHAKVTVGPFLMVEYEDYWAMDIETKTNLSKEQQQIIRDELKHIPYVDASKVNYLSNLLFMAVGFMNNISANTDMLAKQTLTEMQGQISEYIRDIKHGDIVPAYPIELEHKLLYAIKDLNKENAIAYLNDLLGHIFFSSNGDFNFIKSSVHELLILISRATIDSGADSEKILTMVRQFAKEITFVSDMDSLCIWFSKVVRGLMDEILSFKGLRHFDIIHKVVDYMRAHYAEKFTLEDVAKIVYISPSYLSRIFKKETGVSFNHYLNNIRIEKSKHLLLSNEIRLVDIAPLVGFEDQSYYSKVFKRTTGILPSMYRDKNRK